MFLGNICVYATRIGELLFFILFRLINFESFWQHGPDKHLNMPRDGTVHELTRNVSVNVNHLSKQV